MEIRTDLPFDNCDSCPEFILDVDEQVIFADNNVGLRVLNVRCRNENLCRRLEYQRKEQNRHE